MVLRVNDCFSSPYHTIQYTVHEDLLNLDGRYVPTIDAILFHILKEVD